MNFGQRLKLYRESREMSREAFAKELGMSYSTVAKYESGERSPDRTTLVKISSILGISVNRLLGTNEAEEKELDWPQAQQVLFRAKHNLTPEQQQRMIRLMEAYVKLEDEANAQKEDGEEDE